MPFTYHVILLQDISVESQAQRNNLFFAVESGKYKMTYAVHVSSSKVTEEEVRAIPELPKVGTAHPRAGLATCINVSIKKSPQSRKFWMVEATFDDDWIINAITDNPLNQPPVVKFSGPAYERPVQRDAFGATVMSSSRNPFTPAVTCEDNRGLITITRNEATFDEAFAKQYRKKLNRTTFAGAGPLDARINVLEGELQRSNGVSFWQVNYEIETRQFPDTFLSYQLDADYRDIDGLLFRDSITGQPMSVETMLNGRGRDFRFSFTFLKADITSTATTIQIDAADDNSLFPPSKKPPNAFGIIPGPHWDFQVRIEDEIINVIGRTTGSPNNTWTVQRGFSGTVAASHGEGQQVKLEPYYLRFIPHGNVEFSTLALPVV